jgi:hypothetical protein
MSDLARAETPSADVYDSLNHPLRRRLLVALLDREDPVDVEELAAALTDGGQTGGPSIGRPEPPAEESRPLAIRLHHVHLPRLADRGWLDYDPVAGIVWYRSRLDELRAALDAAVADLERLREAVAAAEGRDR